MYNVVPGGSVLNFDEILRARKEDYRPFTGAIEPVRKPLSLTSAIAGAKREGRNPVIAEIKPASPTAGALRAVDPADIADRYEQNGACAISVLTEPRFFGGSLEHLRAAAGRLPMLRKDFLFDPSQIREAYFYGADSVLLISSFFTADSLSGMLHEARRLGMEPLVEVHSVEDAERASSAGAKLYAINNRDKDTLEVDLRRTERLAPKIGGVRVSASGIETPEDLRRMLACCDAALIGSALMRAEDIGGTLRSFVYGGA
jgi:indole-3-glycerol phosphate synthase